MKYLQSLRNLSSNDKLLYVTCALIGGFILIRDVGDFAVSKYMLLFICIIPMFFLNYTNFLALLSFLFALTFGTPSNYIYVVAVIAYLYKTPHVARKAAPYFFVFSIWTILLELAYSGEQSFSNIIGFVSRLFLFFFLIAENNPNVKYDRSIGLFAIGSLVMGAAVLGFFLKNNDISSVIEFGIRLGDSTQYLDDSADQGMRMNTNANNVACFCICGMACCINLFYKYKKIIWVALFISIFAVGMLTISRAFLLLSVVCVCLLMYLSSRGKLPVVVKIIYFVIVAAAIYYFLTSDIALAFEKRVDNESLGTSGRSNIIFEYWEAFISDIVSVLVGAGVFTSSKVLNINLSTHNMLQQILVSYGMFGFIAFMSYMVKAYMEKVKLIQNELTIKIAAICPLFMTILFQQSIQFIQPADLMLPSIICYFAINNYMNDINYAKANIPTSF